MSSPAEPTAADFRALRQQLGSQAAVARMLDCPQATLSRLEGEGKVQHPPKRWHVLALLYLAEHEGRTPWDASHPSMAPEAPPE